MGVACTNDGGVDTVLTIAGGADSTSSTTTVAGNLVVSGTSSLEGAITSGSGTTAITLPTSKGSADQVLKMPSNGAGTLEFGTNSLNNLSDVSYSTGDLAITGINNFSFANNDAAVLNVASTSGSTVGRNLTISAGSAASGSNDIECGDLILSSGGGGSGTGTSEIIFKTKVSGASTAQEKVRINSDGKLTINNTFSFPTTSGSAGQVLKYPSSGSTLEWGAGTSSLTNLTDVLIEDNSLYIGNDPSSSTSTAQFNIGVGTTSLSNITVGDKNASIGYNAGLYITEGSDNVALGNQSIQGISGTPLTGSQNTCLGSKTGFLLQGSAASNTLIGYQCGDAMTTASGNTAVGDGSGGAITTSKNNVLIGQNSGSGLTSTDGGVSTANSFNTMIGYGAGSNLNSTTANRAYNITLIGNGAQASSTTANHEVTLGNSLVRTLRCASATIATVSDKRDKTEIKDSEYGLEFIEKVRPRTFKWDRRILEDSDKNYIKNGKKELGFIAQELQEAMDVGENEFLNLVYESNPDRLEIKPGGLIPILVKSIQDLNKELKNVKQELTELKETHKR